MVMWRKLTSTTMTRRKLLAIPSELFFFLKKKHLKHNEMNLKKEKGGEQTIFDANIFVDKTFIGQLGHHGRDEVNWTID